MRVDEAVARRLQGPVRLRGYLMGGSGAILRLCSERLESFPPQCGGASVAVEGIDASAISGLREADGIVWTDHEVEVSGDLRGETLRVHPG